MGEKKMIFDSHAHYDDRAFDVDREYILEQLPRQGIGHVIDVGADLASTERAVQLANTYEYMYAAVGVHPSDVSQLDENALLHLKELCQKEEKVVAVGEIGLDYHYPDTDKSLQQYWFERQLNLAVEVDLPVIIHSRDAAEDTISLMKRAAQVPKRGVIHCYSYSKELAEIFLDMGYYFGIGGVLTFKNGRKLKETVERIPLDRLLLETDCPYLAPMPFRGERNTSMLLPYVIDAFAEIKGISKEEVIEATAENAGRLFGIALH